MSLTLSRSWRRESGGEFVSATVHSQRISAQKHGRRAQGLNGKKPVACTAGNSSDNGDLLLLFEGKILESLMEALVVGILLFHFFLFTVVALLTSIIFVIKLPPEEYENL